MSWKNILVHIDGTARVAVRLALAVALAKKHQARLTGVFGQLAEPEKIGTVVNWPSRDYIEAAAASKAQFESAARQVNDARWLDVNRGSAAEVTSHVVQCARFADLVVMGQYDSNHADIVVQSLVEEVVLHSGRPVLIVPFVGDFFALGNRPLIAWTDATGSARAVHEALPLIDVRDEVRVVCIADTEEEAQLASDELAANLRGHGMAAHMEPFSTEDNDALGLMDMVLNRASDHSADLLVVGGEAPSGLFAGRRVSDMRYLLTHMTLPVLMSS